MAKEKYIYFFKVVVRFYVLGALDLSVCGSLVTKIAVHYILNK